MRYLVAYDIRDSRRLRQVARACEDFGVRVEYSVFECELEEERFQSFWNELQRTIDQEVDVVIAYRICASCLAAVHTLGKTARRHEVKPAVYCI